ncbi:hypothetical protein Bca101_101488 [Brassica carinata]
MSVGDFRLRGLSVGDFRPRGLSVSTHNSTFTLPVDCPGAFRPRGQYISTHIGTLALPVDCWGDFRQRGRSVDEQACTDGKSPWTVWVIFAHEDCPLVHISARWPFPWTVFGQLTHVDSPSEEPTSKDQKQRRYERLGCHKPVIPVMCRPSQTPHLTMSSAGSTVEASLGSKRRGCYPASDSRILSWLFDARGKLERAVPSPSPADTRRSARHVSGSSSPPTVGGFELGPRAQPSSQSFSGYGSILPTSLAYIVPSTRGCSPWRPDAVMSTTGRGGTRSSGFSRARECTDTTRRASFAPIPKSDERLARQYRCGPPPYFPLATHRSVIVHHLSGPDRHAHTRTLLRRSRSVGCAPVRDPANQLPYALRVYSPVDSHTCQTPWSVFQDGSNGEPTGRRPEHADAEARREARAADHD